MPEQALAALSADLPHHEQRSFLLSHDPHSLLSILTSPLLLTHASATFTTTNTTDKPPSLLSSKATTTTLYIPAFSLDDTTLGVAITHTTTTTPHPLLTPPSSLHVTRFTRSPTALLAFSDHSITHTHQPSPRRRTATTFTLSAPAHTLDLHDSLTSLTKAEFAGSDTCRAIVPPPSHALDFSRNTQQTERHTGTYHGAAVLQYLYEGCPHRQANLAIMERIVMTKVDRRYIDDAVREVLARGCVPRLCVGNGESDVTEQLLSGLVGTQRGVETGKGGGRRERNRVAAAKSNRKRQFRNRWLRIGVVVYRLRANRLVEIRRRLLRERFWLKERCRRELGITEIEK